jgi:hypothetical protein
VPELNKFIVSVYVDFNEVLPDPTADHFSELEKLKIEVAALATTGGLRLSGGDTSHRRRGWTRLRDDTSGRPQGFHRCIPTISYLRRAKAQRRSNSDPRGRCGPYDSGPPRSPH